MAGPWDMILSAGLPSPPRHHSFWGPQNTVGIMHVPSMLPTLMLPSCLWAGVGESMSMEHREWAAARIVYLTVSTQEPIGSVYARGVLKDPPKPANLEASC